MTGSNYLYTFQSILENVMRKSRHALLLIAVMFTLPSHAWEWLVIGEARITQIETNWGNEGRFAVYVEGEDPNSRCHGWIHFHEMYLPENSQAHSFNFSMATSAMVAGKTVEIAGANENCWEAISIRIKS